MSHDEDAVVVEANTDAWGIEVKGKGGDGIDHERRGDRGGTFDALAQAADAQPGQPAPSVEGWIVFVSNLDAEVKEDDLKDCFSDYGVIKGVRMNLDTRTCKCIGHALVEYTEFKAAQEAVQLGDGLPFIGDLAMKVAFAFVVPPPQEADEDDDGAGDDEERKRDRDGAGDDNMPAPQHTAEKAE
jgi:RNA-binding protein 8A